MLHLTGFMYPSQPLKLLNMLLVLLQTQVLLEEAFTKPQGVFQMCVVFSASRATFRCLHLCHLLVRVNRSKVVGDRQLLTC